MRRITLGCALVLGLFLAGCSGDDDDEIKGDNTVAMKFLNMEGVEYKTSDNRMGVTGENGSLRVTADTTVEFYLGNIVFGEVRARSIVTVVDLVPGAQDENNVAVFNMMRCLLSLDGDGDLGNGVQILSRTRTAAQTVETVSFDMTEAGFATAAGAIIGTLVEGGSLVSPELTRSELRSNLLSLYIGYYQGSFTGDDSGSWSFTVDGEGIVSGEGVSSVDGGEFTLTGTVNSQGRINDGVASSGASFSGGFDRQGGFSGVWENVEFSDTGTLQAEKTQPPGGNGNASGGINTGGAGTSTASLSDGVAVFDTVAADIDAYLSGDITIKAPVIAENGAVVPVTVTFPSAVGKLWVFVDGNDEKVAAMVDYRVAEQNGHAALRLKLKQSSNVIAVFDNGSTVIAAMNFIQVTIGGTVTECQTTDCFPELSTSSVRTRASMTAVSNSLKLLITSDMNRIDYISSISAAVDGAVFATAYFSPYVAKNPYLELYYPTPVSPAVSVTVNATEGRTVTVSTQ